MVEPWNESLIAGLIARQVMQRKYLVVVDRCNWTGHECDLLAVTHDLRLIDIEIKISRADLKADAKKDKWWHRRFMGYGDIVEKRDERGRLIYSHQEPIYEVDAKPWPHRVWKHYYAMPAEIWREGLEECMPSEQSGIILLHRTMVGSMTHYSGQITRSAKANKHADKITAAQAVDIARLASLRMWNAYDAVQSMRHAQRANNPKETQ